MYERSFNGVINFLLKIKTFQLILYCVCYFHILEPLATSSGDNSGQTDADRYDLAGLSYFLEAGYSGVMYAVLPKPRLLSQYKFASEALKVGFSCNGGHVYITCDNSFHNLFFEKML